MRTVRRTSIFAPTSLAGYTNSGPLIEKAALDAVNLHENVKFTQGKANLSLSLDCEPEDGDLVRIVVGHLLG